MLSSIKKFRPASNAFIYPYLIQTDSKGLITSVSESLNLFFSRTGTTNFLYKKITDVFELVGRVSPSLNDVHDPDDFPEIIDLVPSGTGELMTMIRWICSPLPKKENCQAGWQFTGIELPMLRKAAAISESPDHAMHVEEVPPFGNNAGQLSGAISITDLSFRVIYQNASHENLFKHSIESWARLGIMGCLYEPTVIRQVATLLKKGNSWSGNVQAFDKEGAQLDLSLQAQPLIDHGGETAGYTFSFSDINDKKTEGQQLGHRSAQLGNILDSITDGFFILDNDFRITVWNREAAAIIGLAADEIIGHKLLEKLPVVSTLKIYRAFLKAFRKKLPFSAEQYVEQLGLWLEINAYPYAEGLFVYFKDVTKRKKQEMLLMLEKKVLELNTNHKASLRNTVDYFLEGIERIFPGMRCSVLEPDDKGSTLFALSAPSLPVDFANAINGQKTGPIAGSCGTAVYFKKRIIVDDITTSKLWENYVGFALQFDIRACWSIPILNNQERVLAAFAMYYRYPKSPTELELNILDRASNLIKIIIEHKHAEAKMRIMNERYNLATKATNEVIWDWDMKSCLFWSDGFYTQFGYSSRRKLNIPNFWESRIHPDDRDRVVGGITAFIQQKENTLWRDEYRFKKANGKYILIADRGLLMYDEDGHVIRMVGSMQDITEKREMEKKLLQQELTKQKLITQAVVDAQEKERAEIGKDLHDNVNQILSTTKLYLELARTEGAERMNLLERSEKNISHAINEIRNISRSLVPPSIGDLGLVDSVHDLVENIKGIKAIHVEFLSHRLFYKKVSSQQQLMLFRIIQEQINNVLKHAEARNLIIELMIVEQENRIELNITDDGRGIESDKMKNKKGMGLSNIINRADLFGGRVSILSAKGQGCKLSVQVPIQYL